MKNYIIVIIVLLALGAGAFVLLRPTDEGAPSSQNTESSSENSSPVETKENTSTEPAAEAITITYTDDGFDKESYEIAAGGTVTVVNNASDDLEFSSDNHPTHTINTELNTEALSPGQSTQITVERAGSWGIHDHLNAQHTTLLVVR